MADKKEAPVKEVLFECLIHNIWTSKGKLMFEETMMLDPVEAAFLNKTMKKRMKDAMEKQYGK